ncbi:MAG: PEP-utilizing enzyme, partial [Candidatus Micrarchaeota archaeon]|nr:PEP-utilizing enzyme [Candidatus Micrarchaeota archaeon]
MVPEGRGVQACYADDPTGWNSLIQSIAHTHLRDAAAFTAFQKKFDALGKTYLDSAERLSRAAGSQTPLSNLGPVYAAYFSDWLSYTAALWASYLLNEYATATADAFLARRFGAEKGAALSRQILTPSRSTEIADAIRMLSDLKQNGGSAQSFLDAYPWFSCLDVHNAPWTLSETEKAIASARPLVAQEKTDVPSLLNSMPLSEAERFLLESAHALSYIKDQRDVYRRKGVYAALPFYTAVGKKTGQRFSDVAFWTYRELLGFLSGGPEVPLSTVNARKQGFLLYGDAATMTCVQGPDVPAHLNTLGIVVGQSAFRDAVRGLSASPGLAQGAARIVRTVSDLDKVQEGDVLVAVTTHPDFVPAMHRACAIVTDEGGLTSHAAIVSREFKIPCIVGTKNATTAFSDGDVLLVD